MIEDIPTLQNMVKKRDTIITEQKLTIAELEGSQQERDDPKFIDYEELVIQLKGANGETARLEEELDVLRKTHDTCLADRDSFAAEFKECQKILIQEQADRSEIEDKLTAFTPDGTIGQVKREGDLEIINKAHEQIKDFDQINLKRLEQIKILEEKLALCDKAYQTARAKLGQINKLSI